MFTVAMMQRNNELLPLLSAGVSTRRAVAPLLLTAGALLGLAVLEEIEDAALLPRVNAIGEWFGRELRALQSRSGASIVDVRGSGLMWGIELDRPASPIAKELLEKGFVVGTARENVIRLLPPYVTPKKAFVEFITALEQVLGATQEKAA